jgi:hypothetical protein
MLAPYGSMAAALQRCNDRSAWQHLAFTVVAYEIHPYFTDLARNAQEL